MKEQPTTKTMIDALNLAARVMRTARMLPDGRLTEEHQDNVRRALTAYIRTNHIYLGEVAKGTDFGASTVSQWLNRKYRGDAEKVCRQVNQWMESHARRMQATLELDYVPTEVAEGLRTLTYLCQSRTSMGVAIMPSGTGKTMLMQILSQELTGWYLYCHELMVEREFLLELSEAVGAGRAPRTRATLLRKICEKLTGTNRPLFLDEAHRLPRQVFPLIRTLHDRAAVPIIMAGTSEIVTQIDDSAMGRGQMASRTIRYDAMSKYVNAGDPGSGSGASGGGGGGKALFKKSEIKKLFEGSQVRFDPDGFELAWAIACVPGYGSLRTLKKLVEFVLERWPGEAVTREMLLESLPLHFGGEAEHVEHVADAHVQRFRRRKVA